MHRLNSHIQRLRQSPLNWLKEKMNTKIGRYKRDRALLLARYHHHITKLYIGIAKLRISILKALLLTNA